MVPRLSVTGSRGEWRRSGNWSQKAAFRFIKATYQEQEEKSGWVMERAAAWIAEPLAHTLGVIESAGGGTDGGSRNGGGEGRAAVWAIEGLTRNGQPQGT